MLKKSLAAALGAMLMAGTAGAVEVAQGGKGDLLIAPMFMTGGGWTSELKVINTNTVDSAVAKVVFHGPVQSEEVLDFLIFLSPGDVWTGTVQLNDDGTVGVASSDPSSILVPADVGTKCPTVPAVVPSGLDPKIAKFTTPHTTGYATVTQARMLRNLGSAPLAKEKVLRAYSDLCSTNTAFTPADTDNVLVGSVTLSNPQNGNKLSLPMTALANYDNLEYLKVGVLTSFYATNANSSKAEVEDALWASNFAIPFNNAAGNLTFASVTFPTKETYANAAGTQYQTFRNQTVPVAYSVRNEEEEVLGAVGCLVSPCTEKSSDLPNELNIVALTPGGAIANSTSSVLFTERFNKGWVNFGILTEESDVNSKYGFGYEFGNKGQQGVPALVTYIHWDHTMGGLQGTWQYAAKTYAPNVFRVNP